MKAKIGKYNFYLKSRTQLYLRHHVQTGTGAHSASYTKDTEVLYSGVKRPGREADHSPPSTSEIKNAWSNTSIHPYVLMGC